MNFLSVALMSQTCYHWVVDQWEILKQNKTLLEGCRIFVFLMEDIFSGRGTTVVLWLENKNSSSIVSWICEQITIIPAHLQVMKILNIIV